MRALGEIVGRLAKRVSHTLLLGLFAWCAHAQIVVTPTLVSAQSSNQLYCAAKPTGTPAQVQMYCFTSVSATWDTLIFNSVFTVGVNAVAVVPDVTLTNTPTNSITWIFQKSQTTGTIAWQLALNGSLQSGTF